MAKYYDRGWNPVIGCGGGFRGCGHCFARALMARRSGRDFSCVYESQGQLARPFQGEGELIAVCVQSDLFQDRVGDGFVDAVIRKCNANRQNRYLFLTKHSENLNAYFGTPGREGLIRHLHFGDFSLEHMAFGVTVCCRDDLHRLDDLRETAMIRHRFVSFEPLLEDLGEGIDDGILDGMEWVILGAETGEGHSETRTEWLVRIAEMANRRGIPLFVNAIQAEGGKVTSEFGEMPEILRRSDIPYRMGSPMP